MSANDASIVAVIGASGSGKSLWIKQQLKRHRPGRLLIWDPQAEYQAHGRTFTDRAAMAEAITKGRGAFRCIYSPGDRATLYPARFDWFCRLAYALGNLTLIVEELADVTTPQRAPDAWSVITRKGRHKGLRIVAASQRPAGVDKDFFGNCTLIHCGRLVFDNDVRTMERVLARPDADLMKLSPLAYIERNMATGECRTGTVKPPK